VTCLRQTGRRNAADVTEAEDCDSHDHSHYIAKLPALVRNTVWCLHGHVRLSCFYLDRF
jgi:hypothetical protein